MWGTTKLVAPLQSENFPADTEGRQRTDPLSMTTANTAFKRRHETPSSESDFEKVLIPV